MFYTAKQFEDSGEFHSSIESQDWDLWWDPLDHKKTGIDAKGAVRTGPKRPSSTQHFEAREKVSLAAGNSWSPMYIQPIV